MVWALGTGSTAAGAAINSSSGVVSATGVGTVVFNAYRSGDGNYNQSATTGNFTLTVNPIPTSFTVSPTSFSYNGAAQGPTLTPSPAAATYSTTGAATATNVGSYSVTATANGNYTGSSGLVAWSIGKGTPSISISPSSPSVTVGGSLTFTASGGQSGYAWSGSAGATGSGTTNAVTFPTIGTFTVTVQDPGGPNWNASNVATATITVLPFSAAFTISPLSLVYSGSTQGPTITPAPAASTYTTSGVAAALNAGTYSVTATATGLYSGSSSASWSIVQATPTVVLTPSDQTVVQGTTLTFTPSGGQNSYSWSGTAGATGISTSKTITFSTVGSFTVSTQSSAGGNYTASNLATTTITVVSPSLLSVSGGTDFGTVRVNTGTPLTSTQTFTLSNTGGRPLSVTGASASGDFTVTAVNGGAVSYPLTITAGSSATLTLTFNATAAGSRSGTLSIINTSTNNPTYSSGLTGFGLEGILSPSWSTIRNF